MSDRWTVGSCKVEYLLNQTLESLREQLLLMQDVAFILRGLKKTSKNPEIVEKRLKKRESAIHSLYVKIWHYENIQKKMNKKEKPSFPPRPSVPFKLRSSKPKMNSSKGEETTLRGSKGLSRSSVSSSPDKEFTFTHKRRET